MTENIYSIKLKFIQSVAEFDGNAAEFIISMAERLQKSAHIQAMQNLDNDIGRLGYVLAGVSTFFGSVTGASKSTDILSDRDGVTQAWEDVHNFMVQAIAIYADENDIDIVGDLAFSDQDVAIFNDMIIRTQAAGFDAPQP